MAKNENTDLKAEHSLYLATTGYGKSQTLKRTSKIPPDSSARVILWDNNKDHQGHRFDRLDTFAEALYRADDSGGGYRIAYTGDAAPELFEMWAKTVWQVLNGNKITYLLIEEYSDCCSSAGPLSFKKDKFHRRLWTQSRKYGGILHATSQRSQMISKDSLGQAAHIWASDMDYSARDRVAKEMGLKIDDFSGCSPGEFWHYQRGCGSEKIKVFTPR